ncbi:MAG: rod shape-determining protein RodA [Patescibacteria group bacterium]
MIARLLRQLQQFDWILLLAILILFAFGLSAIYSVELSRESSNFIFLKKHLIAFGIGFIALMLMANANYLQLRNFGRIIYILGILLLVGVLFFGTNIRGTTGWFSVAGFSFQPVEFVKIALAIELARYFGEHARRKFGWREIFGSGLLTAVPVFLTILQPDYGSASLLVGMWFVIIFFAGVRWRHMAVLGSVMIAATVIAWMFVLQDYQKDRIDVFFNPDLDPLVTGYNITQARIAIGSGQLFGRGLGFGSQSQLKFLPEAQTDFVFAVIAEELGFFGLLVVFIAIGVVLWRILLTAYLARDHFSSFLAIGIFGIIFIQATVNIGVNLAMLPTTGVTLPYISYGGSSLIMFLLMIGVVQSIAVRLRPGDKFDPTWYNQGV